MAQNYLVLNQSGYYFRIVVPVDLRDTFGLKEIRRSLKTGILGLAKEKARLLAGKIQQMFRTLREGKMTAEKLDQKKIQELVDRHVKETLEYIDEEPLMREHPITFEEADAYAQTTELITLELQEALVKGDFKQVGHIADGLLEDDGITGISKNSMDYKRLCREVLIAVIELNKVDAARTMGDYAVQYNGVTGTGQGGELTQPVSTNEDPCVTLAELINIYMTENKGVWSRSTNNDYSTISRTMMRIIPADMGVHQVNKAVMRMYRETLQCLPLRFLTTKKYDGMTAEDIKALGLDPGQTVSPQTVNKHLSFASGLFHYAVDKGYMDDNPAGNMKVPEKVDPRGKVDPFSPEDLQAIFSSPGFGVNHPYQFWIPVLGLFTGARLNELCQLYVADVKQEDDIWYLDINEDTPDKSLKRPSSKRLIPLHPVVIDLGFIDYVESLDHERVWPELNNSNQSGKYGHYFGRHFNTLLSKLNIKPSDAAKAKGVPNKTFHSFRHAVVTTLTQAGVDSLILKQFMGHKEKGVTYGTYFKGYPVHQVYEQVTLKIEHAEGLIDELKGSKWTK